MSGPAGLSEAHRVEARRVMLIGVNMLMSDPQALHYTQGPERWEGIAKQLRIGNRQKPTHGDCSSTHSWLVWNALTHVGAKGDHLNGLHWTGGYTGTIATHGFQVPLKSAMVGDAVLYGHGWPYEHVATYIGGGRVFSHGSEASPFILEIDYRSDRAQIRRHF